MGKYVQQMSEITQSESAATARPMRGLQESLKMTCVSESCENASIVST